jgi:hypothetical protein
MLKSCTFEQVERHFKGDLEEGDVVRSSPNSALEYPYAGGIHEKEPCFGVVTGWTTVQCNDGWRQPTPIVDIVQDIKNAEKRHPDWWILCNKKEIQYLIDKYGELRIIRKKPLRARNNNVKDYDPLLKSINSPFTQIKKSLGII